MDANVIEIAIALGSLVGLIMGLTGAGGSIFAVPILMLGLHLRVLQAVPIALMAVMLAACVAAIIGLRQGIVRYKAASVLAISGLLVAPAGVWLAHHAGNRGLAIIFALILSYVAIRMLLKTNENAINGKSCDAKQQPCKINPTIGKISWNAPCARAMLLSGALTGLFSGLLGVGGGFVIVPALRRYTDFDMRTTVATSLTAVAIISLVSAMVYGFKGAIDWQIARPFVLGAVIGMMLGKLMASHISGLRIQQGFAVLALLVAFRMIFQA